MRKEVTGEGKLSTKKIIGNHPPPPSIPLTLLIQTLSLSLSLGPPSNTHRGTIAVCAHDGQINACQCSAPMRCFCRVPATHDDARKGQGNEIMYELVCGDPG